MAIPLNVLFLHGGPGLTAEFERRHYGTALPVHWWDQPHGNPDASRPYPALVEAAIAQVERLALENHGRVALLASSFGAYLARELAERVPEHVGAITISGGVWDLCTTVLRLGWHFVHSRRDADLATACCEAAEADTPQGYFALFARVSAMPGFLDCCWSPAAHEQRETMKALAAEGRLIDWPACQSLMIDALATAESSAPVQHRNPVRIVMGRFDPCFDEGDAAAWRALWPGASVQIVDTGQFPHLELPPSAWMPSDRFDS